MKAIINQNPVEWQSITESLKGEFQLDLIIHRSSLNIVK